MGEPNRCGFSTIEPVEPVASAGPLSRANFNARMAMPAAIAGIFHILEA